MRLETYKYETNYSIWKKIYKNKVSKQKGSCDRCGWHRGENFSPNNWKQHNHYNWKLWRKFQFAKDKKAGTLFLRQRKWKHIGW